MLREVSIFVLKANLEQENGTTFSMEFNIIAKSSENAITLLEKYLTENKKDTRLIYKRVVGISNIRTDNVIMNVLDDNTAQIYKTLLNNDK